MLVSSVVNLVDNEPLKLVKEPLISDDIWALLLIKVLPSSDSAVDNLVDIEELSALPLNALIPCGPCAPVSPVSPFKPRGPCVVTLTTDVVSLDMVILFWSLVIETDLLSTVVEIVFGVSGLIVIATI